MLNGSIVVKKLMASQAFYFYAGRKLTQFKKPKILLTSENKHDLLSISCVVTQIR